jgi:hypothetical protein
MVSIAEKSELMLIDDLDELQEGIRSGLIMIILQSKIPAVMVSAMNTKKAAVKMAGNIKTFDGICYWVENGIAEEV